MKELEIIAEENKTQFNQIRERRSNDLYVNCITGDDTYPGSFIKPFRTIQKAIDVAGNNQPVIHIASGIYTENINITASNISLESLGFKDSFIRGIITIPPGTTNVFFRNLNISHNIQKEAVVKDTGSFGRIKFDNVTIAHDCYDAAFEAENSQNEIEFNNCTIKGSFLLSGIQIKEVKVELTNTIIDGIIHLTNDKHLLNIKNSKYVRCIFHDGGKLFLSNIDSIKNSMKLMVTGIAGTNILKIEGGPWGQLGIGHLIVGKYIPPGTTVLNYNSIAKELTISQPLTQNNLGEIIEMFIRPLTSTSNTGYLELRNSSFKNSDWATYSGLFKIGNCDYRFINLDRRLQDDLILNGTNLGQGVNAVDINSNIDNLNVNELFIQERTKRLTRVYNPGGYINEEKLVTIYSFNGNIPSVKLPTVFTDELEGIVLFGGLFGSTTGYILRKGIFVSTLNTTGYNAGAPVYATATGSLSLAETAIILSIGANATLYINLDGFTNSLSDIQNHISDKNNPHEVSALQLGLNNLLNERQIINASPSNRLELRWTGGELEVEIDNAGLTPPYELARRIHTHSRDDVGLDKLLNERQVVNKSHPTSQIGLTFTSPDKIVADINNGSSLFEIITKNNGFVNDVNYMYLGNIILQWGNTATSSLPDGYSGINVFLVVPYANTNYVVVATHTNTGNAEVATVWVDNKTVTGFQLLRDNYRTRVQDGYISWFAIGTKVP